MLIIQKIIEEKSKKHTEAIIRGQYEYWNSFQTIIIASTYLNKKIESNDLKLINKLNFEYMSKINQSRDKIINQINALLNKYNYLISEFIEKSNLYTKNNQQQISEFPEDRIGEVVYL